MSGPGGEAQSRVEVSASVDAAVSLATLQNQVPAVKSIVIVNGTDQPLRDLVVRLSSEPAFAVGTEARVALVGPGQRYELHDLDLELSPSFMLDATERTRGLVHVQVSQGDEALAHTQVGLDVLAYDEWTGARSLPELIAAFVLPNHPVVEQVLADAVTLLEQAGRPAALDGYQRQSRQAVMEMVGAIYEAVQRRGLRYINPPASFEESGQKVRTPDRVMASRLGTCLDLCVLFGACFEQAGLHPLVVFQRGHAFVGAWLEERTLATPTSEDGIDVRKRVDGHHMVVLETTLVTQASPVPFERAMAAARRALEDDAAFRYVVDIARARKAQVRPIHGRVSEAGVFEPLAAPPRVVGEGGISAVPHVPEAERPDPSAAAPRPETRLDRWKHKLLDLSLHNRLLNFVSTSKKTVRLLCPDPAAFEDRLADGKRYKILGKPTELEGSDSRDAATFRHKEGDDAVTRLLAEALAAGRIHASLAQEELDVRLTEIYREARLGLEESGTSALYCAIGMLDWLPKNKGDQIRRAPLLLVPVELSRTSIHSGFRLELGSDEPRVNVTLLQMLAKDHELSVPGLDPLPTDEHGIDVTKVLATFRKAVGSMPRWEVREEVHLGFFSFSKFLMWRDLQEHEGDLLGNEVVRHLVQSRDDVFDAGAPVPAVERLDQEYPPARTWCPLSADSSQLQAIFAAEAGRSFVLEGPPGTGKSQTIANIIVQCLAQSKTVLFVAEKNVALGVVQRRLQDVGLDDFCLELHSSKARKADVIAQLERAMTRPSPAGGESWEEHCARLEALRRELNDYVEVLHRPRADGVTVHRALTGSMALAHEVPLVPLQWPPGSLDRTALEAMVELVRRLATVAEPLGELSRHPWRAVQHGQWSPAWQDGVEQAGQELGRQAAGLAQTVPELAELLGIDAARSSHDQLRALLDAAIALVDAPYVPESLLIAGDFGGLRDDATALVRYGSHRDQLRAMVLQPLSEGVLAIDLDRAVAKLQRSATSFPLLRFISRWLVRFGLRHVIRPGARVALDALQGLLEKARELRGQEAAVAEVGGRLGPVLGRYFGGGNGDWPRIEGVVALAARLRAAASALAPDDPEAAVALRRRWAVLLAERGEELRSDGRLGQRLRAAHHEGQRLEAALATYAAVLGVSAEQLGLDPRSPELLARAQEVSTRAQADLPQLRPWCQWQALRTEAVARGLAPLVEALEGGQLRPRGLEAAFHRGYYHGWLRQAFADEPRLTEFNAVEHDRKIQRFRALDDQHRQLSTAVVRARLSSRAPVVTSATAATSSLGIIRRETQKKRRHKAVRTLLAEAGDVVLRLTPCFLMSPISVAQYLAPGMAKFDLVIFDEASQIPAWDAVGAMARGTTTIVVGDPKQLPPTSFFERADDDDTADDLEDLESILDDCLGAGLPHLQLRWHYRSRHESLIAFSNHHYYGNNLLTFPSADAQDRDGRGVSLRYVANGVYDKGKTRTNRIEAEAVVAEIVRRLRDPEASHSIGVVTFNSDQMRLVEDLLDQARRTDAELDAAFDEDDSERVLIKNLESIQGDERDVIFFSIGFGPDLHGKIGMNFGPMNRDGGHRRLNVAITRARKEVIVFSSLRADQLDLSRTNARGVHDLRSFLAYAEHGYRAIAEVATADADADFDSPFEREVCNRLRERGWVVHLQVGCSGYRIDLAVVDPDRPGRYLMGIECDGATYHRAATARDRDKLRESVLRGLGWTLHRIWSTDWWHDAEGQTRTLHEALERELAEQRAIRAVDDHSDDAVLEPEPEPEAAATSEPTSPAATAEPPRHAAEPYRPVVLAPRGSPDEFYEATTAVKIREAIAEVVAGEGPISAGLLARRVAAAWSFGRVTARARTRIDDQCRSLGLRRSPGGEAFVWPHGVDPATYDRFRASPVGVDPRDAEDVPIEEIASAVKAVLGANVSMPELDLVRETARLLGFQRMGPRVRARMEAGVAQLCERGGALRNDGTVSLAT